jgi:hypothetical protein
LTAADLGEAADSEAAVDANDNTKRLYEWRIDMKTLNQSGFRLVALVAAFGLVTFIPLGAQQTSQRTYASPEEAASAFFMAVSGNDSNALTEVFGVDAPGMLSSGDPVADQTDRQTFLKNYQQMHRFMIGPDNTATLYVGAENWPFPIPLAQKNGAWFFDTEKGKQEIVFRRIGNNEHSTIVTMLHLTDAQKEFASQTRRSTRTAEYAQRFSSEEGKQNGLYWTASDESKQSPIGPRIAGAAGSGAEAVPFHGYIYRMLNRQGASAPGGAMNYRVNGKMTRGFAFVAYPAEYKSSGVMTFIAGKDGRVYAKDLGPNTTRLASSMTAFNPDKTWRLVGKIAETAT